MKTTQNFGLLYFMLAAVQIIICNCFYFSPYVFLSILPAMVLPVVQAIFGKDLIEREEDFSFRKYGAGKVSVAVLIMQGLFLAIYITADGAGTRPFWFNASRFGASLAAGYVLSMIVAKVLLPEDRK